MTESTAVETRQSTLSGIESAVERVIDATQQIESYAKRLRGAADAIHGVPPSEPATAKAGETAQPEGAINRLHDALNKLTASTESINQQVMRIEN